MGSFDESPVLAGHDTKPTTRHDDPGYSMYHDEAGPKDTEVVFHPDLRSSTAHTEKTVLTDASDRISSQTPNASIGRTSGLCSCKRLDPACTNRISTTPLTSADGTLISCPFSSVQFSSDSPDDPSRPSDPLHIRFRSPYLTKHSNDIDVVYEGSFPPLIDLDDDDESVTSESSLGTDSTISSSWDALPFPELNVNDLILDFDGSVLGGTLSALVERLTHAEYPDMAFRDTFMTTFMTFATLPELYRELIPRYNIELPENFTPTQIDHWERTVRGPVRLRVINTLKSIIQEYKFTTRDELAVLTNIENFLKHDALDSYPSAQRLLDLIQHFRRGESSTSARRIAYDATPPPTPHIPEAITDAPLMLLDLEPLEVARQLTLMESVVLRDVHPKDLLMHVLRDHRSSAGRSSDTSAVSILLRQADEVSRWVCSAILDRDLPQDRALVINHFITIAEACRSLNSLTMTAAIFSGLTSLPVGRLYQSWAELRCPTSIAMFLSIEKFLAVSENPTEYRTIVKCLTPPCLPDIRVYLAAIRQIHQTMRDTLDADGNVIHFRKRHELASIIAEIQNLQWKPYNLLPVEPIRAFLSHELQSACTMGRLFDWSLNREPDLSLPTLPISLVPL